MRVRVDIELDVGDTPVADAITYLLTKEGIAPGDDDLTTIEWVEAVVLDTIEQLHLQQGVQHWSVVSIHTTTHN